MDSNRSNGHRYEPDAIEAEEQDSPDIQELLDLGYEQLDGFVAWLERDLGLDARAAQQDCFNAESYVDFLANHQRKAPSDANEFDLRWFVFSHYIRKSMADRDTQERLPASLLRFYQYLQSSTGFAVPEWVLATLEDLPFFLQRLRSLQALAAEDEADWKEGFRDWCQELEQDLDLRCLWLPDDLGEGMTWADPMGWREATLREEANRIWQRERDELIANGLGFDDIRARLLASYLIWLDTSQDRLDGASPRQTIRFERADDALRSGEEDNDGS